MWCTCISIAVVYLQHHGIFKKKHQREKQVHTCQFTVPEVKIAFVLFYWLILTILLWANFSRSTARSNIFNDHLRSYADCIAGGSRKHHDCRSLRLELEAEINPVVEAIYLTFTAFLNFASLPFVIQFQTVKHSVRRASRKLSLK